MRPSLPLRSLLEVREIGWVDDGVQCRRNVASIGNRRSAIGDRVGEGRTDATDTSCEANADASTAPAYRLFIEALIGEGGSETVV